MTRNRALFPLLLVSAVGCGEEQQPTDLSEVKERIDALERARASLAEDLTVLEAENTYQARTIAALQDEIEAINGAVDLTELSDQVAQNTSDIDANATDVATIAAGYLTSADLDGLATETYVDTAISGVDFSTYVTTSDLSAYATQTWVASQGYGAATNISANTAAIAAINANYLTSSDLSGYATQSWVDGQGYSAAGGCGAFGKGTAGGIILPAILSRRRKNPLIADANPHKSRHTFGRDMAKAGVPPPVLQKLMGHADLATTTEYINFSLSDVAEEFHDAARHRRVSRTIDTVRGGIIGE